MSREGTFTIFGLFNSFDRFTPNFPLLPTNLTKSCLGISHRNLKFFPMKTEAHGEHYKIAWYILRSRASSRQRPIILSIPMSATHKSVPSYFTKSQAGHLNPLEIRQDCSHEPIDRTIRPGTNYSPSYGNSCSCSPALEEICSSSARITLPFAGYFTSPMPPKT